MKVLNRTILSKLYYSCNICEIRVLRMILSFLRTGKICILINHWKESEQGWETCGRRYCWTLFHSNCQSSEIIQSQNIKTVAHASFKICKKGKQLISPWHMDSSSSRVLQDPQLPCDMPGLYLLPRMLF